MKLTTIASTIALLATPALAWETPPPPAAAPVTATGGNALSASQAAANARAAARSSATSTTGPSSATGGTSNAQASTGPISVVGGGSGGGGGRAPDIYLSPGYASGNDCPTVGFGAAGSGIGGGGGFGPSWISSRCDHRKYAMDVIRPLLGPEAALAYLASVEPDVKQFAAQWSAAHATAGVPVAPTPARPDVCAGAGTWTAAELRRHPECRG